VDGRNTGAPAQTNRKGITSATDEELYRLLQQNSPSADAAFTELYARHSNRIFAYCRTFFRDLKQVEDMFQETFIRFYERARREAEVRNVRAYIMTIARNLCINAYRDMRKTVSYEEYHQVVDESGPETREMSDLVEMALDSIHDDQREAIFLYEYDGLSYSEIANLLGVTQTAVRLRVHRGRKAIRKILRPYLADLQVNVPEKGNES
jgi:RNA polymerase sigma-70 factor (ECF subfamily)